jgi:hypothetical protein
MTMLFFLFLAVACFANLIRCILNLKLQKSGDLVIAKKLSFNKYIDCIKLGKYRKTRVTWYVLNVEIPGEGMNPSTEILIETTNRKAKKYKNKPDIELFVTYRDGRVFDAMLKEDLANIPELLFSLIMGVVSALLTIMTIVLR